LGAAIGLLNGLLVAYGAASSFIITLGMGTICTGIEFLFTGQKTIFDGIPASYASLGQGHPLLDLPWTVFAAVALAAGVWITLDHTEYGRRLLAVGGSEEAARLAGLRTRRLRASAFVVSAVFAALAGVAITSAAASSTPQAGLPYLLPAFAAVFLGSAVFRVGQFNAAGTIVGVVLLQVIQTGLLMLSISTALINIIQGTILIVAILLSRFSLKVV
jgi:ribose transport system permease protein